MPKRPAGALCAVLTFAAVLAVVPVVTAEPAEAHPQTRQQCAYDPFAGNQCWKVNVAHTHSCGAGMTGTYPNCYPAPSTNQQNTGDEEAKKKAEEARKKAEAEKKRKEAEEAEKKRKAEEAKKKAQEQRKAEEERKRKEAEEAEKKRKRCDTTPPPAGCKHQKANEEAKEDKADDDGWTTGSAYGLANAWGKVLNWFEGNKDTLADPPQALTDAVKSQTVRDAAKTVARGALDFMENNPHLFGKLTIAQQKALGRLFLDAPPEAQVVIGNVACGSLAVLPGGGTLAVGCGIVLGISAIHDDKVRPWLKPFSDILLPEDDGKGDKQDTANNGDVGQQPGNDDEQPTPTTQPPTPTTEASKKVTGADVQQAGEDLDNGKITEQQYKDIQSRWYCQMGMKRFC